MINTLEVLLLQTSQQQWRKGLHDDQWLIMGHNGKELGRLPKQLSPEELMQFIHFARRQQMVGFEVGVEEGLRRGAAASKVNRDKAANLIAAMKHENKQMRGTIAFLESLTHKEAVNGDPTND